METIFNAEDQILSELQEIKEILKEYCDRHNGNENKEMDYVINTLKLWHKNTATNSQERFTLYKMINTLEGKDYQSIKNLYKEKYKDIDIRDTDFSFSVKTGLQIADIYKLSDLIGKSKSDLLKIRNIGKKTYRKIMERLECYGLEVIDDTIEMI